MSFMSGCFFHEADGGHSDFSRATASWLSVARRTQVNLAITVRISEEMVLVQHATLVLSNLLSLLSGTCPIVCAIVMS